MTSTSTSTSTDINPGSPRRDGLDRARAIADAVLYEGYLLYPYRASSSKNQVRWQFGVCLLYTSPSPRDS